MKNLINVSCLSLVFLIGITTANGQEYEGIVTDYPKEQQEVIQTIDDIMLSVKKGDVDKLIGFHFYSPKFTEFKQGAARNGAEANEAFEREVFGNVTEVVKMDARDLKVAVYHGKVANATFHSDFHLKFGDDLAVINDQITLLFVKNGQGEWKIVHEHHSPLAEK
ncbi:YybH family protein [Cyclobacterium jeungdonense]|uniref:Nuclear transport factor 2 family protein n=1 Tax=Cyclobacterium jeungdonense TaxID=708087 RepID=A0ABT8C5K9_9BACT|nr:nuclear transport factor 2 family protein [Cyclobacterium jeungdonense]MDN3687015.1 nuclear transport factor 2 family protein [Cyclobacterium jeungdonense]